MPCLEAEEVETWEPAAVAAAHVAAKSMVKAAVELMAWVAVEVKVLVQPCSSVVEQGAAGVAGYHNHKAARSSCPRTVASTAAGKVGLEAVNTEAGKLKLGPE